jgi:hypothetical protein
MARVGTVPPTTSAEGATNNPVDPAVREGVTPRELSTGPNLGEKGEYKPAAYTVSPGLVRVDS